MFTQAIVVLTFLHMQPQGTVFLIYGDDKSGDHGDKNGSILHALLISCLPIHGIVDAANVFLSVGGLKKSPGLLRNK
jgi:hypothetical protein